VFVVNEADAAAIRAAHERDGELSAMIQLRRLFPGITDNENARACVRPIAGWSPLPVPLAKVTQRSGKRWPAGMALIRRRVPFPLPNPAIGSRTVTRPTTSPGLIPKRPRY
jgi:hypothetical protein